MSPVSVIYLLHESTPSHGVHVTPTVTEIKRYALRKSVSSTEFYNAQNIGMQLSYVFTLVMMEEYDGEKQLKYEGHVYDITRTYETKEGGIELTVQRSDAE